MRCMSKVWTAAMNISSLYYVQFLLDDFMHSADARGVFILCAYVWKDSTLQVFNNFRVVVHKLFYPL